MGRVPNTVNISNYHYKAEFLDDNEIPIGSKYFFTMKELCAEFKTSSYTVYKIMKNKTYKPTASGLKNVKFYKDIQPALIVSYRPNEDIYGELDES